MKRRAIAIAIVMLAVLGSPAGAQYIIDAPKLAGVWNPVVGAGSVYRVEHKGSTKEMWIAVVGKEAVDGGVGFWTELSLTSPPSNHSSIVRRLIVRSGDQLLSRRTIIQPPGTTPMEVPAKMMLDGENTGDPPDVRPTAERVGTEDVTTPAGTFSCTHYRKKGVGGGDIWLSDKVSPWSVVKTTGPDATVTLVRLVTDATTRITGTPKLIELPATPGPHRRRGR